MDKTSIDKITRFIDSEIEGYPINYEYEIEDDTLIVTFSGHFFNDGKPELTFIYSTEEDEVQFYSKCEAYLPAETREFWIELLTN